MDIDKLFDNINDIRLKVDKLRKDPNYSGACNFDHIVNNSLQVIMEVDYIIQPEKVEERIARYQEVKSSILSELETIQIYLHLMNKYPSFREAELSSISFNDINHLGKNFTKDYTLGSKKRLEQISEGLGRIFPGTN